MEGSVLFAELIAALMLIVTLVGFAIKRSTPWLVSSALAAMVLLVAVSILVDWSA
jgi:hypothetical protein